MLDIQIPESGFKINHKDQIVLLGSCFSDEMHLHFANHGFNSRPNLFGTLFHPSAIARLLRDVLEDNTKVQSVNRKDLWFDWRSSFFYGESEEELQSKMELFMNGFKRSLTSANVLILTFGTAWGYRFDNRIVANCHKMPSDLFSKELTSVEEMHHDWENVLTALKKINPGLNIIFTVSPVRHSKDGVVENNRSKARLIELVHRLSEFGVYFPSYEIVIDQLRDYRFFKKDLVHPNEQAIEFIWDRFAATYFNEETKALAKNVVKLNSRKAHKSLYPESQEDLTFRAQTEQIENELRQSHPYIFFK